MTTKLFEDYLTQLDRKVCDKNFKILLFVDQCISHPRMQHFTATSKLFFPHLTILPSHSLYIWGSSINSNVITESLFQRLQPK
jgi:hypothetical protein